jgi:hypothetical protein
MSQVQFGGMFSFRYPGKVEIDKDELTDKFNELYMQHSDSEYDYIKGMYHIDTYEEKEGDKTFTALDLSTNDKVDKDTSVVHQMLLEIGQLFGDQALKDVRASLRKYAANGDSFKALTGTFPPPATTDRDTIPASLRSQE